MVLPLLLAGAALNPIVTTVALLVEDHAGAAAAEAFGWQSTSLALGAAAGNALSGPLAQHHGASAAFPAAPRLRPTSVGHDPAPPRRPAVSATGQPASPTSTRVRYRWVPERKPAAC